MNAFQRSSVTLAALLALGGTVWVGAARSQTAGSVVNRYYDTQQAPALETLVPPGG